jgi:hypothetical protein
MAGRVAPAATQGGGKRHFYKTWEKLPNSVRDVLR